MRTSIAMVVTHLSQNFGWGSLRGKVLGINLVLFVFNAPVQD